MQVTVTLDLSTTLKATLRDGKLSAELTVTAPYGVRTVSVSETEFPPELLEAAAGALQNLLESRVEKLVSRAQRAAHEAAAVAARLGEDFESAGEGQDKTKEVD